MVTNLEVHPIQSSILIVLLSKLEARFSQLNKLQVPSDQFNFHLKALIANKLVEKTTKGLYKLTNSGKEFANRFDTDNKEIEKTAYDSGETLELVKIKALTESVLLAQSLSFCITS